MFCMWLQRAKPQRMQIITLPRTRGNSFLFALDTWAFLHKLSAFPSGNDCDIQFLVVRFVCRCFFFGVVVQKLNCTVAGAKKEGAQAFIYGGFDELSIATVVDFTTDDDARVTFGESSTKCQTMRSLCWAFAPEINWLSFTANCGLLGINEFRAFHLSFAVHFSLLFGYYWTRIFCKLSLKHSKTSLFSPSSRLKISQPVRHKSKNVRKIPFSALEAAQPAGKLFLHHHPRRWRNNPYLRELLTFWRRELYLFRFLRFCRFFL